MVFAKGRRGRGRHHGHGAEELQQLGFGAIEIAIDQFAQGRPSHRVARGFRGIDEGSAYLTMTKNIYASFGSVVTANANANNNTGHLTFTNNWVSGSANPGLGGTANVVSGNISINGSQISGFPADAQTIANAAGLEPAYADLKTNP